MTSHTSAPSRGWKAIFWRWAIVLSLACIVTAVVGLVIAIADFNGTDFRDEWIGRFGAELICAVVVPICFWVPVGLVALFVAFMKNVRTATTPLPSLQQIDQQLRLEGYEPTLQDVLAVHAHLRAQRSEAALVAGAIFVGLHEGASISR